MWTTIFRSLEVEYPEGYLFWDKAGRITRNFTQTIPGLHLKNQHIDQRELSNAGASIELLYGIRVSMVRSIQGNAEDFQKLSALMVEIITEELEIEALRRFRVQLMLAWPCKTQEEAFQTTLNLIPKGALGPIKGNEFQAAQVETIHGAVRQLNRFSIVELQPPPGPAFPIPEVGKGVPYSVVTHTVESFESGPIREFDPAAVLESIENRMVVELSKTATISDEHAN